MDEQREYLRATFAAGCFWDVEAAFRKLEGVVETLVGYTGGQIPHPSYDLVEGGLTGHAEAVGIMFDPALLSYDSLLETFWMIHNPTHAGGQGEYQGPQYRSVIFFHNEAQKIAALQSLDRIRQKNITGPAPILTEILPAQVFWPAEECHQRFYEKCGHGYCISRQADE
jgi:methionine-S-sulfoxide reductase